MVTATAVEVVNASKRYHISQLAKNKSRRWLPSVDSLTGALRKRDKNDDDKGWIWALRDVNLKVARGESWGLIGRNGSGKTTLLRLVANVTKPTYGTVSRNGTVAAMLAASTGFNPELSGRENLYLSAAISGFRRKAVDAVLDDIIDFAGIGALIDTPVKRYSSGMLIRLAFAVAVNLEPDILLVDEILTVGDYEFRLRSLERLKALRANSDRTVLLVSHNLSIVKAFCEQAVWLEKGQIKAMGSVDEVIRDYVQAMSGASQPDGENGGLRHEGDGNVQVDALEVVDHNGSAGSTLVQGETARFRLHFHSAHSVQEPIVAISLTRVQDNVVATRLHSGHDRVDLQALDGHGSIEVSVPELWLMPGDYRVSVSVTSASGAYDRIEGFPFVRILPGSIFNNPRLALDASDMVTFVPSEWHVQAEAKQFPAS